MNGKTEWMDGWMDGLDRQIIDRKIDVYID